MVMLPRAVLLLLLQLSGTVGQCTNTCLYASDSLCDDGGVGSEWSDCALGTDCMDCGPRGSSSHSHQPQAGVACTETCVYASDGDCDDGGPGAEFTNCSLGTDCTDCGPRSSHSHTPHSHTPHSHSPTPSHSHTPHSHAPTPSHSHTPHSHFPMPWLSHFPPSPPFFIIAPPSPPFVSCENTCVTANDGACDDGGEGSENRYEFRTCQLGSDCNDCGPRDQGFWYCINARCESTEFIWMPEPDPSGEACITDMDCMCNENPKFEPEVCAECEAAGISWFQTNPPFWKNRCIPIGFKVLLGFSMATFVLSILTYLRQLYRHCTGQHEPTYEYPGDWYTCMFPTDAIFKMEGCDRPWHNIMAALFGFVWLASCYVGVVWKPSTRNITRSQASIKV